MATNRIETDSDEGWTVTRSDLDEMSLGVAVPAVIASRTDTNVLDLDPLSTAVDVDAIDGLWGFTDSNQWSAGTCVTFHYMGYEVSVIPGKLHLAPFDDDDDNDGDPTRSS